ncbi:growth hormone secretagogue receptor type 1-like [Ruditapes philippinarum]|uniref:growth hormone secretagogue receptor type 1-like n=1 Tax=Ruditapes philippinarum TaxID=129788 RepID=UPI00295BB62D|nr:growth hormone secretagogue receptor type 1-like [Ruditapes philippinarum]
MEQMYEVNRTLNDSTNITDIPLPIVPKWGFWVKFVITPIIVFVGIAGNVFSFIVMKTKTLRHKSYSHYLCALAVFDTMTLMIRQVESVDEYLVSHLKSQGVFQHFNDGSCKFYNFIVHVITLISSWLVVLMAVERLLAVCFPFKKVYLRKETGAALAIVILFITVCLSQLFRFTMIEHAVYDDTKDIQHCLATPEYREMYTSLDVYFFLWTLVFFLPVTCIVICNSFVLYHIFRVRKDLHKGDNHHSYRNDKARGRRHRSTCMLLIVTTTYIVTLLPLFTLSLIVDVTIKVGSLETARYTYITLIPYIDISVSISLLNYAVNFFIYVLSGKRFRFELQKIFRKKRIIKRSFTARSTREEFCMQ